MSNYSQIVSFGPKDALTTGDSAKKIKGVELDAELAAISTAVATKEDTANKGANSGYCPLNSSAVVPDANMPTGYLKAGTAATITAAYEFDGNIQVDGTAALNGTVTVGASTAIKRGTTGSFINHGSSNHASGVITVSTSAPSGGSNGDVWFKV